MHRFPATTVATGDAVGRVLRQAVHAERDQPPFDRVMMDGIALSFDALADGGRRFTVQATQHAGDTALSLSDPSHCIEIMTGAVMPGGCDCVVPVERIDVTDGVAAIGPDYVAERGRHVHPQGSDHHAGDEVLAPGTLITPMDIAIIVSCGLGNVSVSDRPAVRVVSTGNELVPPGDDIAPHQVRLSNGPAVVAMLQEHGFADCDHEHLVDDPALLESRLAALLAESKVLILSGGVSMGKADFVPQVLTGLGVELVFHGISQRPGKPMWFGIGPDDQAVFALPGNPVSTLFCCRHYVLPSLLQASGRAATAPATAVLTERYAFKPALTCFLPVTVATDAGGTLNARPAPTNTSGDFTALHGTDGYVELERDRPEFEAGIAVPMHFWSRP